MPAVAAAGGVGLREWQGMPRRAGLQASLPMDAQNSLYGLERHLRRTTPHQSSTVHMSPSVEYRDIAVQPRERKSALSQPSAHIVVFHEENAHLLSFA